MGMTQTSHIDIDIDTLTGRELDAAVAEVVMGWVKEDKGRMWTRPHESTNLLSFLLDFSTDERYAAQVEAEIKRRDMKGFYITALIEETHHMISEDIDAWLIATASPEQRCRAALKAVMG